jgi:muramidase (phage lysozyme)
MVLDTAISKLNTEWVSLPGGSQSHMTMETAKERFQRYGGTLKEK